MEFADARRLVQQKLDKLFADDAESPKALPYGFDTGAAWAPKINWNGVMGVYIYLVDKRTGALRDISLPEFQDMPDPRRVGPWPATRSVTLPDLPPTVEPE